MYTHDCARILTAYACGTMMGERVRASACVRVCLCLCVRVCASVFVYVCTRVYPGETSSVVDSRFYKSGATTRPARGVGMGEREGRVREAAGCMYSSCPFNFHVTVHPGRAGGENGKRREEARGRGGGGGAIRGGREGEEEAEER